MTYSTSELALGLYAGILTISDSNATNNPQTIEITLGVCEDTDGYGWGIGWWTSVGVRWYDAEDRNIRGPFTKWLVAFPPYAFLTINDVIENPYPDKFSLGFSPSLDERPLCLMPAVTGGTFALYFANVGFVPEDDYVAFDVTFYTSSWPLRGGAVVRYGFYCPIRIDGMWSPEEAGPFKGTVLGFPGSETDPGWRWGVTAVGRRVSPGNWRSVEYSDPNLWSGADMVIGNVSGSSSHKEAIFSALASGRVTVVDESTYDMLRSDARLVDAEEKDFTYGAATLSYLRFDGGVLVKRLGWGSSRAPIPEYRDIARALNRIAMLVCYDPDGNSDGIVDFQDFALLAQHWETPDCNSANNWCDGFDVYHDGCVAFDDVLEFTEYWLRVAVPNLTGMSQAEAEAAIVAASLVVGTITQHYHYAIPAGNVISAKPFAGTIVKAGSAVNLDISIGPDPTCGMVWVSIKDPGVSGHEGFNGYMNKYETTNAQYCQFLNAALASGDITVDGNDVIGASGSNSGADYAGEVYYDGDGPGCNHNGAPTGGAARINYIGGVFGVDAGFENHPVTYVSWYGATAFCNYYGYRLPTEWEWQAVADYDGSFNYGCGTSINNSIANYYGSIHPDGTTIVGAFGTYGYGMCDMAGNLWEWTSSYDGSNLHTCGSSWGGYASYCSVSFRSHSDPSYASMDIGFRVCRNISTVVPNVTGMTQAEAEAAIVAASLIVGTITQDYHATIPSGNMISSEPFAGTTVIASSRVNLLISMGPCIIVPNVTGMTQTEGEAAIVASSLVVGIITEDCHATIPSGNVISSEPVAGTTVIAGSRVNLLISMGPCINLVLIPSGTFQMGDSKYEGDSFERPVHTVQLDSFYIGKFEVTNQQYCEFLNNVLSQIEIKADNIVYMKGTSIPYLATYDATDESRISFTGSIFLIVPSDKANHPVIHVTWFGAAAFCNWRSQQTGKELCYDPSTLTPDPSKHGYRLATEAEWEFAARGGLSGRRFPWDDIITASQANYDGSDNPYRTGSYPWTSPVGFFDGTMKYKTDSQWPGSATSYQTTSGANNYGLYDIAGNVWEWCNDWYSGTYYSESPYDNPTGATNGPYRVLRGGGWNYNSYYCRVAHRGAGRPASCSYYMAFRIVLDFE